ncbi:MAG TPA: UDP-N-acetylmuramate dehydrogenase [Saprospiraceae bacterium]|nr:UDP-N-acetylmuramate dehydrogenase [Saprospiraceae bacterium]
MTKTGSKQTLAAHNTMGIAASAQTILSIDGVEDLWAYFAERQDSQPFFILGGGSNVLFIDDYPGTILKMNITHRSVERSDDQYARVEAGAGESWPDFVAWTLDQNLGGLENLSLIPGQVGAAPIQNIGAYGVELKDRLVSLEAYEIATGRIVEIANEDCGFDYRYSHFKGKWKDQYIITKVIFKLSHRHHQVHTEYGAIERELAEINQPTIQDVAAAVIRIRQSKLPDPQKLGNAGSFFKNPIVDIALYFRIQEEYAQTPAYPVSTRQVKIPAAWLIDQCGWKGKRQAAVGCYEKQPLVIANYGGASGAEVWAFAQKVRQSVHQRFGILLEPEVNIIP